MLKNCIPIMNLLGLLAVALALVTIAPSALADDLKPLSADELRQLFSGAIVKVTYENGNTVIWTNETDGTLSADWNSSPASLVSRHHHRGGQGTWKVTDDGKYCVRIEWPKNAVDWCRPVVKSDDGTYVFISATASPSRRFSISR